MPKKEDKPKEELVRVAMQFPESLKAELQELAGPRGLTNWIIDACQERLAGGEAGSPEARVIGPKSEINEARKLAQLFADHLAVAEDTQTPHRVLQEMDLPEWLNDDQWPDWLQSTPSADFEPKAAEPEVESPQAQSRPVHPKVETVETVLNPWEPAEAKDDLFARTMAKAEEMGLGGAGLVPASSLPKPKPEPVKQDPDIPPESVVIENPKCSSCGGVLVEGTCWSCAF